MGAPTKGVAGQREGTLREYSVSATKRNIAKAV